MARGWVAMAMEGERRMVGLVSVYLGFGILLVGMNAKTRRALHLAALGPPEASSYELFFFIQFLDGARLISRWNRVTHTFIARWGEFTPTLEDDMVLMKLPIRGSKFFNPGTLLDDSQAIVTALRKALVDFGQVGSRYDKNGNVPNKAPKQNKSTYGSWLRFCFKDVLPLVTALGAENGVLPWLFILLPIFLYPPKLSWRWAQSVGLSPSRASVPRRQRH
ncbi:hypothetical protein Acr_06g0008960 [Actinidia rufa]|uniref:Aminotransferase-like plant mobile domain-containing protein n=1 Tax=Actinidia rufa TaxID=165716 RepID=A0A7J0ERW7_9ERIC|nr:hypothetical protein Acr_06g0008960 [Actinidia rufa]